MKRVLFFVTCAMAASRFPALAQNDQATVQIAGVDIEQPRLIAAEDVAALIDNLSGGLPTITTTRVFSADQIDESYPESSIIIDRGDGEFNPRSRSLVVTGRMNGMPVIEDLRFLDADGIFYVVRDIYVYGQPEDLRTGRAMPVALAHDNTSRNESGRSRAMTSAVTTKVAAPIPQILAIHGYTNDAGDGIVDGKVHMTPCGTLYDGGRAVNNEPNIFNWDLSGSNFGTTKGTIQLAGITVPSSAITQWTPTLIRFYPTVPYNWGPGLTILSITNTSGGNTKMAISVVPAIKTRIYGQCTWDVALTRLNAGKRISDGAYPPGAGWSQITAVFAPQLWDQLTWDWYSNGVHHKHTAIITNVSGPVRNGNTLTWTITIGEANAACNNQITSRTSTFQVQNGAITRAIQTNATTYAPGWYYR